MRVFSARVKSGVIVPEDGVSLPEGSLTDEDEVLESIAEADRGETISASDLLQRLQR